MKKNKNRMNLPLVFTRIILSCSCLFLLNCNNKTNFERDIAFNGGWEKAGNSNTTKNTITYRKEFELDYINNMVYLLQVSPQENILQLQVNNTVVQGNSTEENEVNFNITEQLKQQNTIELTNKNTKDFEVKIHCVNKFFIPDIDFELNATGNKKPMALVEVKIKNAFSTEKQGTLKYTLFSANNEKLANKETPIFIEGNAENLYRQELSLEANEFALERLKVVCQLYVDDKLFDRIDEIYLNKKN